MEKGSDTKRSEQHQRSPGVLNEALIGHFKTIREEIIELTLDSIEPFPLIPDYRDPTESTHPIIIKSPEVCRCVDGGNLIEDARTAGKSSIRCHVFEMANHSDIEFAIRKVSIRTKPHGGTCSYPEILRNTHLLAQLIVEEKQVVVIYSHGGARRGGNFTNNPEDDLREILAERLGKSRTTINTYLNQAEYINETALNALIEAGAGKLFFDKCRVIKRDLIKQMKSDEIEDSEIRTTISEKMLEWHSEFSRTGKVPSVYEEEDDDEADATPTSGARETSGVEIFQHQTRIDPDEPTGPPAEEDVKNEIRAVVSSLTDYTQQTPLEADTGLQLIDEQIPKLSRIRQMLLAIKNSLEAESEKELA